MGARKKAFETMTGDKQEIREMICYHAKQEIPNVRKIFTLPSREALCYHTFKKKFPVANIECIERKEDIVDELHDKGIECKWTDIKTYATLGIKEMHHDVVFLDYYSFLRENILDEIKTFVGNDNIIHSDKPCILGITLSKGMRRDKDLTLDLLSEFRWKGHRTGTENNIEQVTEGIHGFLDISFNLTELEVLYTKQYEADDDKSATMYFILLKIVK
jgi:hypothetical protein